MRPIPCPRCAATSPPGSRFCESCGAPLADNTTRHLCAAVHLDSEFCNDALDEFTVEPVRAVPHAPGLDTAAVLRDALAARNRRRLRDALLFALLLVALVFSPPVVAGWTVVAALVALTRDLGTGRRSPAAALGAAALGLLAGGLLFAVSAQVQLQAALRGVEIDTRLGAVVAGCALAAAAAVLLYDAVLVHWLVRERFRRGVFQPDLHQLPAGGREHGLRTFGVRGPHPVVDRIERSEHAASQPGETPLVVHRGFSPFVGAGTIQAHVAFATALQPRDGHPVGDAPRVDVAELHARIERALRALRTSSSLGPGGRLADIRIEKQLLVSADDLAEHAASGLARMILPDADRPPVPSLSDATADSLAAEPAEWVRYYRCVRVETWERDLIHSTFVHLGVDERHFYLERVRYVLPPLLPRFRDIDVPVSRLRPLLEALVDLFELPMSVAQRARSFRSARPLPQRAGVLVPDRYGAGRSLREIAADDEYRSYFQRTDVVRYGEIVDRVILRAVGAYLDELGYSAVEFQEQFARNIYDLRGANVTQSAFGQVATVAAGPPSEGKARTS